MDLPITGGCACGAVRYECTAEPIMAVNCHCRDCQRASGSAYASGMLVPEHAFRFTKGAPKYHPGVADSGRNVARGFCAECGTHILAKTSALPGALVMKVGTFDDPKIFDGPQMVIFTIDKQPFHHVPPGVPTFERAPG